MTRQEMTAHEFENGGRAAREPIAIVGIGCRLPGGADSPARLWQLLRDGVNAVGPIPADRFDLDLLYDERPATPGKIMTRWGGFLDNIDQFDAAFFGIAPREAECLDPQQRLLLEVAWEALADAGVTPVRLSGSPTGVFVGMWTNDFEARLSADPPQVNLYRTTGSGRYAASGRISYALNLLGPSMTIDTACSSSLVAVHLACTSLWNGESPLALAGGANVILEPFITVAYSQARMMAPDGRCKFGDARADGYVRSEGAAMVVLKRLSDAVADGDAIYAVIRGSAVTNDGRSGGSLVNPGSAGQEEMLRRAYAAAGVAPEQVHYVEAHGTGTRAGDPTELRALGAVLGAQRPADRPCLVGSIKTNIGHTEGAAGVAGLIKVALALRNRSIPASLHVQEPSPAVAWETLRLALCTRVQPWPEDGLPATAGVTSFGIAGTNAHIVLQEAPPLPPRAHAGQPADARAQLLLLSAHTPDALLARARTFLPLLEPGGPALADLCFSAGARAAHLGERLAVVARDGRMAAEALAAFAAGGTHEAVRRGRAADASPRAVFVFPGQGAQWPGMARELLRDEPLFAAAIERCEQAMAPFVDWSLRAQLTADGAASRLDEIDVIQPALFAIQVGLAALWRAWGIEPLAVVGHSMGEVAAAHVAGALRLEDAARIICVRSRLLRRVRGQGAMAVVGLPAAEARAAIDGLDDRLAVAVSNSPRSTVLSGDPAALETLLDQLRARNVFCRLVKVDVASHSPQVDALLPELRAASDGIEPQAAQVPLCSTVSGELLTGAAAQEALGPEYWLQNLRRPVRFAEAVAQLSALGADAFVELSPHPLLLGAVEETLQHHDKPGLTLPSLQRDAGERATLLGSLGALYVRGALPQWGGLWPAGGAPVRLPVYPWQRRRYWLPPASAERAAPAVASASLLGKRLPALALAPESQVWDGAIDADALSPALRRQVAGVETLSAAYFAALGLEAAADGRGAARLRELAVLRDLLPAPGATHLTQVILSPENGARTLRVFGRAGADEPWTEHARGVVDDADAGAPEQFELHAAAHVDPAPLPLPGLAEVRMAARTAWARLDLDEGRGASGAGPLGAGLGLLATLVARAAPGDWGVARIGELVQHAGASPAVWAHARIDAEDAEGFAGALHLLDDAGRVVAAALGVRLQPPAAELLERAAQARAAAWLYEVAWQPIDPAPPARPANLILCADPHADPHGLAEALARLVRDGGGDALVVRPGEGYGRQADGSYRVDPARADDLRRLLTEAAPARGGSWDAVVHLWALGQERAKDPAPDALMARQRASTGSALLWAQALAGASGAAPRLWLVTRGAVAAGDAPPAAPLDAEQGTLWGLGRVIASEHPERWGGLIDLDDEQGEQVARRLLDALSAGDAENQIALRGATRLVARLRRSRFAPATRPLSAQGTYLITGGLGGVGLTLARWMVRQGVRSLALLGRRPLDDAARAAIHGLEQAGAQVAYLQADVAQAESLAAALATLAANMPPLKGIVHTAGVLDDATLLNQSWDAFARVMAAKVVGAWNLHTQTASLDLELFALFSSASALLGTPGQANYAAANAYLDALAHERRAAGLAALSINWGQWGEVGLATQAGRDQQLTRRGLAAMAPDAAAAVFGRLPAHPHAQVVVADADWPTWINRLPAAEATPLLQELADGLDSAAALPQDNLLALLEQTPEEERFEFCLDAVRARVAAILRFESADRVAPGQGFFQMGMDSLMALELRNQLGRGLGRTLPATLAFDYPTANALARYLLAELFPAAPAAPAAEPPATAEADAVEDLTREELKLLLDAELDAMEL